MLAEGHDVIRMRNRGVGREKVLIWQLVLWKGRADWIDIWGLNPETLCSHWQFANDCWRKGHISTENLHGGDGIVIYIYDIQWMCTLRSQRYSIVLLDLKLFTLKFKGLTYNTASNFAVFVVL